MRESSVLYYYTDHNGVDNDYGSIAAGRYGNIILADQELNLKAVIQKGTRIV